MSKKLEGKVALITGATKGIGRGYAEALAREGASLVIVSRSERECRQTAEEISKNYGVTAIGVGADVLQKEDIDRMVREAVGRFERIDILVNNAGMAITKKAEDLTEEEFDRVVNLDLRAAFFCAQAVGRQMIAQKSGKIINIGSILGNQAAKQVLPYAVAKAGVLQMTKALALEWARYNIQVNTLSPGYVMTDMNRNELQEPKVENHHFGRIPLRRYAQVEEMYDAIVFLASDGSNYMTGQQLLIDGGWCAG